MRYAGNSVNIASDNGCYLVRATRGWLLALEKTNPIQSISAPRHTSALPFFVAGGRGSRTYRRAFPATSRFEPHRSASIGHAGWRGRLLRALDAFGSLVPAFAGRECYRIDPKVFRPGASRGVRPARKSSTAVMRRSLRREITVGRRRGVQRPPGWSRARASRSTRCWGAQANENRTPKDYVFCDRSRGDSGFHARVRFWVAGAVSQSSHTSPLGGLTNERKTKHG